MLLLLLLLPVVPYCGLSWVDTHLYIEERLKRTIYFDGRLRSIDMQFC